jgi:hypothetical protein
MASPERLAGSAMRRRGRRPGAGPGGPAPYDWRASVTGASGLNILAGIWLIISPFILAFDSCDAYWNPIVFGAITAFLALIRFGGAYRASELSWLNAAIGAWLFISGFWLASSQAARWDLWIMGIVVFVLALVSAAASEEGTAGPPGPPPPSEPQL